MADPELEPKSEKNSQCMSMCVKEKREKSAGIKIIQGSPHLLTYAAPCPILINIQGEGPGVGHWTIGVVVKQVDSESGNLGKEPVPAMF